jgi:hypothetical protein
VAAWAYPAPFNIYNVHPADLDLFLRRSPTGEGHYPALDQDGAVVAFAVLGAEARVRGQEPLDGVLDVGLGVHPERMSQGVASTPSSNSPPGRPCLLAPRRASAPHRRQPHGETHAG